MTVNTNSPKPQSQSEMYLRDLEAKHPDVMTTDEKLTELVLGQREMRTLVKGFVASMEKNPMFATFGKMFGGK